MARSASTTAPTWSRAQGKVVDYYDKIQLVPFGEYVPMRPLLGFLVNRIVHGFGDMIAGTVQTLFPFKGAQLGVLICYESIFPDLTRRAVKRGADVLVNITNDAWYGKSSAPYQLLAMTAMRAVETKVPMVRVANTGISAVIEPTAKSRRRTPLFKRGTEIEDVSWRPRRTVYTMVGDLFSEICFVLTIVGVLLAWRWPRLARSRVKEVQPRRRLAATAAPINQSEQFAFCHHDDPATRGEEGSRTGSCTSNPIPVSEIAQSSSPEILIHSPLSRTPFMA